MGKYQSPSVLLGKKLSLALGGASNTRILHRGCAGKLVTYAVVIAVLIVLVVNLLSLSEKQEVLKQTILSMHAKQRGEVVVRREMAEEEGEEGDNDIDDRDDVKLPPPEPSNSLLIEVYSSISRMSVTVDGNVVIEGKDRGITCVVLNQVTGKVMATRVFDTYVAGEDYGMKDFLNSITKERIIIFGIKDDGAFQLSKGVRNYLTLMGSKQAGSLGMRSLWAMVVQKDGLLLGESSSEARDFIWGDPVKLKVKVAKEPHSDKECVYAITETDAEDARRREFCRSYEGYSNICNCNNPDPISFFPQDFPNNMVQDTPVVIIAGNRPQYLHRMLPILLSARGANPAMVNIFIDGFPKEVIGPMAVAKLYGVNGIPQTPVDGMLDPSGKVRKTARITAHYKAAFNDAFAMYPLTRYLIVVEEDLEVSPDFFSYFSQTMHLMDEDDSLYCVSAWNDNAYEHSASDPSMLYRVETMPGLGWMLKRRLYKAELEKDWPKPHEDWDWDIWMRQPERIKGRECIIPDISRTFHFGASGVNVNRFFHSEYFKKKPRNRLPYVELKDVESLKRDNYEVLIENIIKNGTVIDHSKTPCVDTTFPESYADNKPLIMYIQVEKDDDRYKNWLGLAKCFKIWDLGSRGHHKAMWRFHLFGREIMAIGVPKSPYSKFMPAGITPISILGTT